MIESLTVLNSGTTVDTLKATAVDKIPSDLEGMEASMVHLLALIDDIYKYVDDVVVCMHYLFPVLLPFFLLYSTFLSFIYQEGHVDPDNKIGRFISDSVGSLPKLPSSSLDKLANDSLQVRLGFWLCCFTVTK